MLYKEDIVKIKVIKTSINGLINEILNIISNMNNNIYIMVGGRKHENKITMMIVIINIGRRQKTIQNAIIIPTKNIQNILNLV